MTEQKKYVRAFRHGHSLTRVRGAYGRIVRTQREKPNMLAEESQRKVVMIMGPSGLKKLLGKSGYEALVEIGYTPEYIARNIARGMKFKLVVFDRPEKLRIATWTTAVAVLSGCYPELAPILQNALPGLKITSLEEFERLAGFTFAEVQASGPSDPRYMTVERLLQSGHTATDVRRFLYHSLHFSELYTGDGYTQTHDGKRGVREYLVPNIPICDLPNEHVIDLNIEIPRINEK